MGRPKSSLSKEKRLTRKSTYCQEEALRPRQSDPEHRVELVAEKRRRLVEVDKLSSPSPTPAFAPRQTQTVDNEMCSHIVNAGMCGGPIKMEVKLSAATHYLAKPKYKFPKPIA